MTTVPAQVTKLSHKAFRALLKKFKRKKKRQEVAKAREKEELLEQRVVEAMPGYEEWEAEKRRNTALWEEFQEKERNRKHREWVLREEVAQAEFRRKKLLQEEESARKEDARKKMLAELEEKALLEMTNLEENKKTKSKKEEALKEALSGLPQGNEPWHNPIAPVNYNVTAEREVCSFFAKTGCCRFGDRCSRGHNHPDVSTTLLIRGMYNHFSIEQSNRDDYDTDMALEYEESETYLDFKSFYEDVLPEFKKLGRVIQFKVCCNHEPHLRGNVFVEFSREEYAVEAFKMFNGRFYAGRQISCEFTHVKNWKSAICGLFVSKRCPKGNNCNFLHVFRNPENEFWAADRNLPERPRRRRHKEICYPDPNSVEDSEDSHRHSKQHSYSSRSSRSYSVKRNRSYSTRSNESGHERNSVRYFRRSSRENRRSRSPVKEKRDKRHKSRSRSESPLSPKRERRHKAKKQKKKRRSSSTSEGDD